MISAHAASYCAVSTQPAVGGVHFPIVLPEGVECSYKHDSWIYEFRISGANASYTHQKEYIYIFMYIIT